MDNVIFKNARIIDGMGNPWFKGSVAIEDGKISEVGRVIRKRPARSTLTDYIYVRDSSMSIATRILLSLTDPTREISNCVKV